jgi:hypothetical protein
LSREQEIIAALIALGKAKKSIYLQSLRQIVEKISKNGLRENWEISARQVLRTLEGVGLVRFKGYEFIQATDNLIKADLPEEVKEAIATGSEFAPQVDSPTTSPPGAGGGAPPPDGGGPDGANGGDGFREVLGHPYLFSLPENEFDELLDAIR